MSYHFGGCATLCVLGGVFLGPHALPALPVYSTFVPHTFLKPSQFLPHTLYYVEKVLCPMPQPYCPFYLYCGFYAWWWTLPAVPLPTVPIGKFGLLLLPYYAWWVPACLLHWTLLTDLLPTPSYLRFLLVGLGQWTMPAYTACDPSPSWTLHLVPRADGEELPCDPCWRRVYNFCLYTQAFWKGFWRKEVWTSACTHTPCMPSGVCCITV